MSDLEHCQLGFEAGSRGKVGIISGLRVRAMGMKSKPVISGAVSDASLIQLGVSLALLHLLEASPRQAVCSPSPSFGP